MKTPTRSREGGRLSFVPLDDLDNQPSSWRLPVALLGVVALLALALWAWLGQLAMVTRSEPLPRLELVSFRGQDVAVAEKALLAQGFVVNVRYLPSEGQPRGQVFSEQPVAGAKVEEGGIVMLSVSDGQAGQAVPAVVGQDVGGAQALLVSNGFTVTTTEQASESSPPGEVISSNPEAGGRVVLGGSVVLVVSSGPAPRIIPDFVGKPFNDVMLQLGRGGFGIGTITRTSTSDQPVGTVLSSDPPAGSPVPRDYPVKLTVVAPAQQTKVPFVVGIRQTSAQTALQAEGLTSSVVSGVAAPGQVPGTVIGQSIPGGAPVDYGTSVIITVVPGAP